MKSLEEQGKPVRAPAYEEGRRFTRIFSRAFPVENMEDAVELKTVMDELVTESNYKSVRESIGIAINVLNQETRAE